MPGCGSTPRAPRNFAPHRTALRATGGRVPGRPGPRLSSLRANSRELGGAVAAGCWWCVYVVDAGGSAGGGGVCAGGPCVLLLGVEGVCVLHVYVLV